MSIAANRINRYYDSHQPEGEEMGQNDFHYYAAQYLVLLLNWLYEGQKVYITGEINLYRTSDPHEVPITPDVVVIKGLPPVGEREQELSSYHIGADGPPPALITEISSPSTWREDLEVKPQLYGAMGVAEYFVYDPHSQPLWKGQWRKRGRLAGWELNPASTSPANAMQELKASVSGQLWSVQLQSRLQIEGRHLRLYEQNGKLRLTQAEAAQHRAETEYVEKLRERERADRLAEFLRDHGFNPDDLV